jgi:hypothetical protein
VAKNAHKAHLFAETTRQAVEDKLYIKKVLESVMETGYGSLFTLMNKLLNICDQQLFVQVSRMLEQHGEEILNNICAHQLNLVACHGKTM